MTNFVTNDMLLLAVRQRLPILPQDASINLKYSPSIDTLMLMVGPQDRWVATTRREGDAILHLDEERGIVRAEIPQASSIFRADWLRHHDRSSDSRKRLGLP